METAAIRIKFGLKFARSLEELFARFDKQLMRISAEGNGFAEQVLMLPTCNFAVAWSAASPTRVGNVVVGVAAEVVTVVVT